MEMPFAPSAQIVRRVSNAEVAYTCSRLRVLERLPGNPVQIEIREYGAASALSARYIPNRHFNRVVGLTDNELGVLPEIVEWYASRGIKPWFEFLPGFEAPGIAAQLAKLGFAHFDAHATVYGRSSQAPPTAPGVTVERVDPSTFDEFLDAHCKGWAVAEPAGFKANVQGWLHEPGWHLYLARYYDQPAGSAILYLRSGVGYCADSAVDPAMRGHGAHQALLRRRLEDAGSLGCDLVCAGAAYLSTSHRNMIRAGFTTLHTKACWTKTE